MTGRSGAYGLLLAAAIGLPLCMPAAAQTYPADRAQLFAYLVRHPGDVPATLRYAHLSHEAGDIEAAIGALERILFFEPNEPNARLYLGILYAKLGSYDMARGYFESVLQHPATPEHIKARASYLLGKANQRLSPHHWNSYIRTGLRWQSNANNEPDGEYTSFSPDFYDPGDGEWLPTEGNPKDDWNVYFNSGFAYAYDFGNQRGDRFEATLTTYSTRQFRFDEFNYNSAELIAGVRFGIPTSNPTQLASIKPYLIASGALLDEDEYFIAGGAGVTGSIPVGKGSVDPYIEAVWREYDDNPDDGTAFDPDDFEGSSGPVYSAGLRFSSDPYAAMRFNGRIGYERRVTDDADTFELVADSTSYFYSEDYLSYNRVIAEFRLPFDIDLKGHQLLVTPLIGFRWTKYDEPDPFVQDPDEVDLQDREDKQFRFGLALDYAINDWAGVGAQLFYTTTDSNLPAYDTDNLSISLGPHFRF